MGFFLFTIRFEYILKIQILQFSSELGATFVPIGVHFVRRVLLVGLAQNGPWLKIAPLTLHCVCTVFPQPQQGARAVVWAAGQFISNPSSPQEEKQRGGLVQAVCGRCSSLCLSSLSLCCCCCSLCLFLSLLGCVWSKKSRAKNQQHHHFIIPFYFHPHCCPKKKKQANKIKERALRPEDFLIKKY